MSHDESMKFILMSESDKLDPVLFENRAIGNLIHLNDRSKADKMSKIYDNSILIGRNFEIQKVVSFLVDPIKPRVV